MSEHSEAAVLLEPIVLLAAAVVAVPLAKRAGLGAVLGYIGAGVVVGPSVLGLFSEPGRVSGIAELGIVLLLFVIGLEMKLSRLWEMRRDILGLGTAQILLSGALIALYAYFVAGRGLPASVVAGLGLALSSTALVMQLLQERREVETGHGRTAFAVLLMQDLAIVPLLALVAFLSPLPRADDGPLWLAAGEMLAAVAAVVLTGRFLLNPLFGLLARSGAQEIMTAAVLLVVLGAAGLMAAVGLSMATGAFLAGLLLAESTYRHELEADIEPFRGLLLGLFFLSVGMSVDLDVVRANIVALLAAATALTVSKTAAIYAVTRFFGHSHATAVRTGLLLAQGGEFGFVLYSTAAAAGVMTPEHASLLVALVTLSMALTPLVVRLAPLFIRNVKGEAPEEDFSDARGAVLVIGFGRVGQLVAQVLIRRGIALTIIDSDVEQIEAAGRFGARVHYGDGTRLDVLRAAGAGRVQLIAVCTDLPETTDRVVALVREVFPETPCVVRSYDRRHALRLRRLGVVEVRETVESALALGRQALVSLGVPEVDAAAAEREVRRRDLERLAAQEAGAPATAGDSYVVRPEPLEQPVEVRP
ncbi:monovalent cation:proton antiporter-2 (CPA2) family protein [Muricoccus aerilatus]|uniref:monovalent cation:proton antiporter-2 (CPA2) family protein n=1 Tax=Muricoccus aerilatus TaxID=452982 RepID=UPI00069418CD|nr:monovalent cation:proton antiporter-2 (CPA2) family protein [Roseomonas aerilata]